MRLIMNDAYVLRCIDSVYILVPYKRTENELRLFNFNKIGAEILKMSLVCDSDICLKKHILDKYEKDGLDEKSYDDFVSQLIHFKILLEVY